MDVDRREILVEQGMGQALTGLGILLGTGRISSTTHSQILVLLQSDQTSSTAESRVRELDTRQTNINPQLGEATTVSASSDDLENDLRSLELSDKAYSEVTKSGIHASSRLEIEPPWNSASNAVAISNEQLTNEVKTICPWWSTPGYQCREHEKGKCSWAHEETPNGLKDPLICSFWADGSRCAKTPEDCRFAHYLAQHRQVAPLPGKKHKKAKKVVPGVGS